MRFLQKFNSIDKMITISKERIGLSEYQSILLDKNTITISENTLKQVEKCFNFLKEFSVDKVIYGVNTGLGPMAQYRIDNEDQISLQYNLIRSHAAGSGKPLPPIYVKAAMISRLKSLSLGYSGIHADVIKLLATLINKNIIPYIPEHGGVGASGDLVQLSHLALILIGEGEPHPNPGDAIVVEAPTKLGIALFRILRAESRITWHS